MKTRLHLFAFCIILSSCTIYAEWLPVSKPKGGAIYALAMDSNNIYGGGAYGVFRIPYGSTPKSAVKLGLESIVTGLVVCGSTMFAGSVKTIYRSTNSGATWTEFISGIDKLPSDYSSPFNLIVQGNNIYAWNIVSGIYVSTATDTCWTKVKLLRSYKLAVRDSIFLAGSVDGAYQFIKNDTSWNRINTGFVFSLNNISEDCRFVAFTDNFCFAATEMGVFRSLRGDTSWTKITAASWITQVAAIGDTLFGLTQEELFKLSPTDTGWTKICAVKGGNCIIGYNNTLLIGTDNQLLLSTNCGNSWITFENSYAAIGFGELAVLKNGVIVTTPGIWGTYVIEPLMVSTVRCMCKSSDKGTNWSLVWQDRNVMRPGGSSSGAIAAFNNAIIIPGERSDDTCKSWTSMDGCSGVNGLFVSSNKILALSRTYKPYLYTDGDPYFSEADFSCGKVTSFAVNRSYMFVSGWGFYYQGIINSQGIIKSAINDMLWTKCAYPGDTSKPICLVFASDSSLFAGTSSGLFVSNNDGVSWSAVRGGLDTVPVNCLAVSGTMLFAGRPDGVYLSNNNGNNWTAVNGVSDTVISFGISDSTIYVTTIKAGRKEIFQRPLAEMAGIVNARIPDVADQTFSKILSVNTVNSFATITFSLSHTDNISITAYTLSGVKVATLVNRNMSTGLHSVMWDTRSCANGVYIIRMQTDKAVHSVRTLKK